MLVEPNIQLLNLRLTNYVCGGLVFASIPCPIVLHGHHQQEKLCLCKCAQEKKDTGKHKLLDMFSEVFAIVICLVYVFGFSISSFVFPFQWKYANIELKVGDLLFKY